MFFNKVKIDYHKRRKIRGVINFVVFVDAIIPQNLILNQQYTLLERLCYTGTRIDYNAEHSANSLISKSEALQILHACKSLWIRNLTKSMKI